MRDKNQRFSEEELLLIMKLTNKGKSLNYLSNLLNVGKSTIYYQVRKFKPRKKKDFVVNLNDFQIGELIGAFAGDGNYFHHEYERNNPEKETKHRVRYFLTYKTEKDYVEYLKNLLINLNLNPKIINRDNSVLIINVYSKEFISFIKDYLIWEGDKTFTIRLKKELSQYSDEFLRGFARGLMDTDGFLNLGNVTCACISEKLIDNLSDIFTKSGLEITRRFLKRGGNTRPLHFVRVRRKSLKNYAQFIGFSSKNKINQMNDLLQMARIKNPRNLLSKSGL